jgi:hypothetical protein
MPEQYLVMVDGGSVMVDPVGRARALALALDAVVSSRGFEVAVAEVRTLSVRALWRRHGVAWRVVAEPGWLS